MIKMQLSWLTKNTFTMGSRLKAVTLIELLITLIVFSFTVSIGYYSIQLFGEYFTRLLKEKKDRYEYYELKMYLQKDFNQAEYVLLKDSSIQMYYSSGNTTYDVHRDEIRRVEGDVQWSYPVSLNKFEVIPFDDSIRMVKGIRLEFNSKFKSYISIDKKYSSEQMMKYEDVDSLLSTKHVLNSQ